jgi:hypothetical protein
VSVRLTGARSRRSVFTKKLNVSERHCGATESTTNLKWDQSIGGVILANPAAPAGGLRRLGRRRMRMRSIGVDLKLVAPRGNIDCGATSFCRGMNRHSGIKESFPRWYRYAIDLDGGRRHPRGSVTVGCTMSRPIEDPRSSGPDDTVVGSLRLPRTIPDPVDRIIFAKIGTELLPNATVTASITPEARSWAGIATETGPPAGYSPVTYASCPSSQHAAGAWWVGGSPSETEHPDARR